MTSLNEWNQWEEARAELLASAADELNGRIVKVLSGLPPRDLLLIELRSNGMSFADIGEELNVTEETARKAWGRAKRRMRKMLTAESLIDEIMQGEWEE